ncbi:MAG: WG repeat-containing protein, partial [Clostridiales bacterium]|nr:WG repeat-containing protein [Clostridiales bacterium]
MDGKGPKLIDPAGELVLDLSMYAVIDAYDDERVIVAAKTSYLRGLVSIAGNEIIPCEYDNLFFMRNGLIEAGKNTEGGYRCALFDRSGTALTGMDYEWLRYSYTEAAGGEEWIAACRDSQCGFLDKSGTVALPFVYEDAMGCGENIYAVKEKEKWQLIHSDGSIVSPAAFTEVNGFHDGLALAGMEGKYGFLDTSGEIVIPFDYDEAEDFRNGRAIVVKNANGLRYSYGIDRSGTILIGPKEYAVDWRGANIGHYDEYAGTPIVPPRNYSIREALLDSGGSRLTAFSYR